MLACGALSAGVYSTYGYEVMGGEDVVGDEEEEVRSHQCRPCDYKLRVEEDNDGHEDRAVEEIGVHRRHP